MDPVRTEVMRNRFAAIAEEASNVAYRTAYTTFVKQTQDYQVALASLDGEFFAYPMRAGVTSSVCQNVRGLVDEIGLDTLKPGDIVITNDPFSGDALCTHTMDIHLLRPVFRDGRIIAFAWAFIHASDIGGAVPGSISPTSYEVFQEGVRIRPALLYREGELNAQLWHFFADNSRIPELIWGDLQAMLAGLALLDTRMQELCARYGTAALRDSIADVIALSELKARQAIARLTDGSYEFSDYLEAYNGDGHIFLHARMTVAGDSLAVDFSGSDPQVRYALNFVTGERAHPFLCMPVINWIQTVEPTIPVTGGIIRPIRTHAPKGTLMNAEFPAAMGNRWVAVMRVYDAVLGCLNQALPGGLAAAGSGQAGIISVAAVDARTGRRHVSVVEPFIGGSGGRQGADGVDGIDQPVAFLRSAPAEVVEVETSLVLRSFRFEPGSAAPGRHRGGYAMRIELENRGLAATVTVRGLDRFRVQPWGVAGGACGSAASAVLNPGTPEERDIGKIDVLEMRRGDVLRMITPSGGGFGDPFTRDPALVLSEVADGLLTAEQARAQYGVAGDAEATAALRAGPRPPPGSFSLGPARTALEAKWPPAASMALATRAMAAPAALRAHILAALRADLACTDGSVTPAAVAAAPDP
ncbi:hydantoinase B/oxoprolinase family protein [Limobrevibacterium gyesilva]|uniref:Hydantoinase B/oxoprolinase family protein n=1 Tax=Limobrevibacterium gyesilva TaxID=2991712 RepID=A0AA42CI78_9PROT|nr:hydantoinase B/oxoprolinase family protein [Limobrevibacterium gyesilva]MCW3475610.1 hydantoinase B/oxoprolinase family protein [Limobrevibacterium gyesilva]